MEAATTPRKAAPRVLSIVVVVRLVRGAIIKQRLKKTSKD
jgi:hypothetical protein